MKYIAIFDIPDGNSIGCALAKTAPDDGRVKCDSDFDTVYANTVKMDEYFMPRYLEIPFYRKLVLDHMACAGMLKFNPDRFNDPEYVWKQTVEISTAPNQRGQQQRFAYYVGQLALLDYIQKMQNTYTAPAKQD